MKDAAPQPVYLADYQPFHWDVESVELTFALAPNATRVTSRVRFLPKDGAPSVMFQHGVGLTRLSTRIDGADVAVTEVPEGIEVPVPPTPFTWEAEVQVDPAANTALEGLYMSNGMYCTQCEAEGFRKITYYPDRPDVMAPFRVRIESDLPVLLSNGDAVGAGDGFAEWHDPWPKPAYLFALVAGDLVAHSDRFVTSEGRDVALNIWVRPGDEDRCDYAMDALKRAMRWDEEVYGRAYDLDIFNIVAVDDFNMGAMENKGLNIFNSKYVLASPETATDRDYEFIEGIVAHEYFHNWTGNRITCRDWFQLCLKEGLTVFRDQQFSGDMRSHPVKRIDDVLALRARQFREDAGPLAHPVRPESYIEINNFYTSTVYEKGAELIGMLKRLVGDDCYAKALDLYFDRHDGQACTIEDWLKVFENATGRDLSQFALWYRQSGTPRVSVTDNFRDGIYTLHFKQEIPETPNQKGRDPQVIPVALGLLAPDGSEVVPTTLVELTEVQQSVSFDGLAQRPIPSVLRDFSAPVILDRDSSAKERAFLLAHDTDPFNRWEAGRQLAKDVLASMVTGGTAPGPDYLNALNRLAGDDGLDPAFRALALGLPSVSDMAQTLHDSGVTPDPEAIYAARTKLAQAIAAHLEPTLAAAFEAMHLPGPYTPDAKAAGCRALRLSALDYLSYLDTRRAEALFEDADNMTETLGALGTLVARGAGQEQLATFYARWKADRLVLDKWFSLQASRTPPSQALDRVKSLSEHPDFDWKNPNRFRSLIGAFITNTAAFHAPSGAGYAMLADWLIKLDPVNPQTAARMTTAFETWALFDGDRQDLMQAQLRRIAARPGLSRDTTEMVKRMLAPDRA